ncbi:hypothetical protein FQ085_07455 [Planococcus sp. ANT_H30]|uniref:CXXC-20-CXXC protein n=1 Tax=Planococcus kocurii TaxID=1374 RepID=A0ABM5WXD3_9BACL|nr:MULTISPECIES: TIGR04104 family putative zinc finger protein [Planococcus]ALS79012.1 hypothetical protein AUO94_10225 [Planococcus kocurii]KAA0957878.1 hypothetical protein FQ085_07455 [Planococcus sp. ANT_H30]
MPTCKHCKNQWTWKQSMKASWKMSSSMRCPYCLSDQYATAKSRRRTMILNWVVLLPLPLSTLMDLSLTSSLLMMVGLFASALLLIPKLLELSNEHEVFW